jgi:hypothetical protein
MLNNIPNIVLEHNNNQLVKHITEEEIAKVVWDMDPDEAPDLDGFSIRFYHFYLSIIKQDLKKMLNYTLQK